MLSRSLLHRDEVSHQKAHRYVEVAQDLARLLPVFLHAISCKPAHSTWMYVDQWLLRCTFPGAVIDPRRGRFRGAEAGRRRSSQAGTRRSQPRARVAAARARRTQVSPTPPTTQFTAVWEACWPRNRVRTGNQKTIKESFRRTEPPGTAPTTNDQPPAKTIKRDAPGRPHKKTPPRSYCAAVDDWRLDEPQPWRMPRARLYQTGDSGNRTRDLSHPKRA